MYGTEMIGPMIQGVSSAAGMAGAAQQAAGHRRTARHARAWSEYMAGTAFQRSVKDLEAAGLNPALAVAGFGPGNVPSGPMADYPNIGEAAGGLAKGVSSAREGMEFKKGMQLMQAQIDKAEADARSAAAIAKKSEKYWDAMGEAEVEAMRTGVEANLATAVERSTAAKVNQQEEKIRESNAAAAEVLKELRNKPAGEALIILREILGSMRR